MLLRTLASKIISNKFQRMLRKSRNSNSAFLPLKYSGNVNYLMCRNFQIFGGAKFRDDFELKQRFWWLSWARMGWRGATMNYGIIFKNVHFPLKTDRSSRRRRTGCSWSHQNNNLIVNRRKRWGWLRRWSLRRWCVTIKSGAISDVDWLCYLTDWSLA